MQEPVKSGIKGLDELLFGGLQRNGCYLVEGAPGTGKTVLGLQFIYAGAAFYEEPGIIISFEEKPEELVRQGESLGWDLSLLVETKKIKILHFSPDVFQAQDETENIIGNAVMEINAKRAMIDSLSHFENFTYDPIELRKIIYNLKHKLKKYNITAILIKEFSERIDTSIEVPFEEYFVDGIIRLTNVESKANKRYRYIEILKSRGQGYISGKHTFMIGQGGISIYPIVPLTLEPKLDLVEQPKIPTGIKGLDDILSGGIPARYSILLLGEEGSGRSTLALYFLYNGAKKYNQKSIFFSFKRLPAQIINKIKYFGLEVDSLIEEGLLKLQYTIPFSLRVDEQILLMIDTIRETGAVRVVIDSLPNLVSPLSDSLHIKEKLFQLLAMLNHVGVTSMLISDVISPSQPHDKLHTEDLVDGVILLKALRGKEAKERYLEIQKLRDVVYNTGNYILMIEKERVEILPT